MRPKSIPKTKETLPGVVKGISAQRADRGDSVEAAKKESSSKARTGSGEDPFVESGLPKNDPERPRETPEEQSNR